MYSIPKKISDHLAVYIVSATILGSGFYIIEKSMKLVTLTTSPEHWVWLLSGYVTAIVGIILYITNMIAGSILIWHAKGNDGTDLFPDKDIKMGMSGIYLILSSLGSAALYGVYLTLVS